MVVVLTQLTVHKYSSRMFLASSIETDLTIESDLLKYMKLNDMSLYLGSGTVVSTSYFGLRVHSIRYDTMRYIHVVRAGNVYLQSGAA